jgi:hypothetical protein
MCCKYIDENGKKCKSRAIYGLEYKKPLYCSKHRKIKETENDIDYINVSRKQCEYIYVNTDPTTQCMSPASHGFKSKNPLYCKYHCEDGMINLKKKICDHDDCIKKACRTVKITQENNKIIKKNFCKPHGESYTKEHKVKLKLLPSNPKCQWDKYKCDKDACYGLENSKTPLYCAGHGKKYMIENPNTILINVRKQKCIGFNRKKCNKKPGFGLEKNGKVMYCRSCGDAYVEEHGGELYDTISKKCENPNCNNTQPRFNSLDKTIGRFCKLCADKYSEKHNIKMVNVIDSKCIHINEETKERCNVTASFAMPGSSRKVFCASHKKIYEKANDCKLKSVGTSLCRHSECNKSASFNYPDQPGRRYCKNHKEKGMVSNATKRCEGFDIIEDKKVRCINFAYMNYPDQSRKFCITHSKKGMINVARKKCKKKDCYKVPIFNFSGETAGLYCNVHKKPKMVDVVNKKCLECKLYQITKKYDYYCFVCFCHKFPNDKRIKHIKYMYKGKQRLLNDILNIAFRNYITSYDSPISNQSCTKRRPDWVIDVYTHIIIIECDEHQHQYGKLYNKKCDLIRNIEIFEAFGYRPIIFVRFNPDGYIDSEIKTHPPLFDIKKTVSKSSINKSEIYRILILFMIIKFLIKNIPNYNTSPMKNYRLFYDGSYAYYKYHKIVNNKEKKDKIYNLINTKIFKK